MSLLRPQTIPSPSWTTAYFKYKTNSLNPKLVKIKPLRVKNSKCKEKFSRSISTFEVESRCRITHFKAKTRAEIVLGYIWGSAEL